MSKIEAVGLFCDDIREEKGGKSSLMGVYDRAHYFSSFPLTLLKFCARVHLVFRKTDRPKQLEIEMEIPDSPKIVITDKDIGVSLKDGIHFDDEEMAQLNANIIGGPLIINSPGKKITIWLKVDGGRRRLLRELTFKHLATKPTN